MNTKTGIWIDQNRAVIVVLNGALEHVRAISSGVASQPRRGSDSPPGSRFDARHIPADATRTRAHASEVRAFFDRVFATIPGAGSLLLLGPGHAKVDFRKHLQSAGWAGRVVGVEPADKMTDRQVGAVVREYFRGPREPLTAPYGPRYTSASASSIVSNSLK